MDIVGIRLRLLSRLWPNAPTGAEYYPSRGFHMCAMMFQYHDSSDRTSYAWSKVTIRPQIMINQSNRRAYAGKRSSQPDVAT